MIRKEFGKRLSTIFAEGKMLSALFLAAEALVPLFKV